MVKRLKIIFFLIFAKTINHSRMPHLKWFDLQTWWLAKIIIFRFIIMSLLLFKNGKNAKVSIHSNFLKHQWKNTPIFVSKNLYPSKFWMNKRKNLNNPSLLRTYLDVHSQITKAYLEALKYSHPKISEIQTNLYLVHSLKNNWPNFQRNKNAGKVNIIYP